MKKTYENKRAFTLIEVILALIIASMASAYVIKAISQNNFNSAVEETQETIQTIIRDGIANTSNGYASASGNNCSSNHDFTNLTTARLYSCVDWTTRFTLTGNTLTGNGLMEDYGSCSFETQADPSDAQKFVVYIDCDTVKYNDRSKQRLEEAIKFIFERELSDIWISTDDNAIDITTPTGGTTDDGKIRATFGL